MKLMYFFCCVFLFLAVCTPKQEELQQIKITTSKTSKIDKVSLVVLGTIQDAGSPHIGCKKKCCKDLFENPDENRKVVSLGVIDSENNKSYLFDATPDFPAQTKLLKNFAGKTEEMPDGIFLTHAHIGHYTGLMYLGREALGGNKVPVHTMPKMKSYLENNGPWSQLVTLENIQLKAIQNEVTDTLTSTIKVTPFLVPHRDEFSETVGYKIQGPTKSVLFIPDIDKWEKWEKSIVEEITKVDYAFVDASFYDAQEINNRDISEIPHPFVIESLKLFQSLAPEEKKKVYFIHFNHTNPIINGESEQAQEVLKNGFNIAQIYDVIEL